jgi:hypothetical protein
MSACLGPAWGQQQSGNTSGLILASFFLEKKQLLSKSSGNEGVSLGSFFKKYWPFS